MFIMRNYIVVIILLLPIYTFSQSTIDFRHISDLRMKYEKKLPNEGSISDEYRTDKNLKSKIKEISTQNISSESTLLDSIYSYQFNSLSDSTLNEKIYVYYSWDKNKVSQTNKKLDTLTNKWTTGYLYEYYYDHQGNIIQEIDSEWLPGESKFSPVSKDEYEFDDAGNTTSEAYYYWSSTKKNWVGTTKTMSSFNSSGMQTMESYYTWDNTKGKWIGSSRKEYDYNESGIKTMTAYYSWDSENEDWKGSNKFVSVYNNHGLQTKSILYVWDNSLPDGWKESSMNETDYYETDSISSYIFYNWDNTNGTWLPVDRYNYSYTDTSKTVVGLDWGKSTGWVKDSKKESYYNDHRLVTLEVNSLWIVAMQDWIVWKQQESTYDDNDGLIYLTNSELDVESFKLKEVFKISAEIHYDENKNRTLYESSYWEPTSNIWTNDYHYENTYTPDGLLTYSFSANWSTTKNKWINESKFNATYDEYGNQTFGSSYSWSIEKEIWIGNWQEESTYDSSGNETSFISYEWDTINNQWIKNYKNEHYFNGDQEETKVVYYNWDDINDKWIVTYSNKTKRYEDVYDNEGNQTLMLVNSWDEKLNEWSPSLKYYFFYSVYQQDPVGVDEWQNNLKEPVLFPNPAKDQINIDLPFFTNARLEIYNNQGGKVKDLILNNANSLIPVKDLAPGLYFFRIEIGKHYSTHKIVID